MNITQKEYITFDEFKAWLTGLIQGKGGEIPDLDDWKQIKTMLDKVCVSDGSKSKSIPQQSSYVPWVPPYVSPTSDETDWFVWTTNGTTTSGN